MNRMMTPTGLALGVHARAWRRVDVVDAVANLDI